MSIYAISDLHLSFDTNKPMDIFGDNWDNHSEKIKINWNNTIKKDDLVLLPGDFSWAMNLEDTYKDFEFLKNLPGKKLLLKGNHDYWWNTINKMNNYLKENNFENIDFLYNNSYLFENYIITGTRGWAITDTDNSSKILKRENLRLELSLEQGVKQYGKDKKIIVCMHYPPITNSNNKITIYQDFIETMKKYNVEKCIYGHLHGASHKDAFQGIIDNIEFELVSCDYTDFKLIKLD